MSGSFDPVHAGHVAFALQAIEAAKLDKVYFAPEALPRRKHGYTHIAHRIAMLKLATAVHPKLGVLELPDKNFSVGKTLPRLQQRFRAAELFYLCGSDMLEHMPEWTLLDAFLAKMELVVGVRSPDKDAELRSICKKIGALNAVIIKSQQPSVSGRQIRDAISQHESAIGLLESTKEYISKNWLYDSASTVSKRS